MTLQKNKLILFSIMFFVTLHATFVHGSQKQIKPLKEYSGSFVTAVKGTSKGQPPYINVIRSKEGITYLFNKFRKIRKLTTHNKALRLERELLRNDFSSRMIIAILSHPTDNYKINKVKISTHDSDQKIEVNVSYFHRNKDYFIPPFKSIYYKFYVIKHSNLPVVINATLVKEKGKKSGKKSFTTVYGTLKNWEDHGKQLALVSRKKRKKRVYYIKGDLQEELKQYVGRFIALRGEVTTDSESVYEADFMVKKIVKIY